MSAPDPREFLDRISEPIGEVDPARIIACPTCTAPRDFDDPADCPDCAGTREIVL